MTRIETALHFQIIIHFIYLKVAQQDIIVLIQCLFIGSQMAIELSQQLSQVFTIKQTLKTSSQINQQNLWV
jgi:hypothetical protein